MLEVGSVIDGKYKILNKVGQGGMSVVYLAMNERANKQWAVKEVRKDGSQNYQTVRQGLLAETEMLKRLKHPNLPSIVDVIDGDGVFLIVMDYIEGNPLSTALQEQHVIDQSEVVKWAVQLCDVLAYLHAQTPPIIYRDMKPANIMLKPDGTVMLIDFGTAREYKAYHRSDTVCLGTRGYAAPEQFGINRQSDARTDIYCLGATLYHLVTGHNPGDPPYQMETIRHWNPKLSSGLEEIIARCTRANPDERYQSCRDLRYDLEHYRELETEYRRSQRRYWMGFATAAILSVFSLAGTVGFRLAENHARTDHYQLYLAEAKSQIDKEQQLGLYEKAISLKPGQSDAYLELLHYGFLDDNLFSIREEQSLRRILGISPGRSRSNESYLSTDRKGYEMFSYQAAMAYYYYFEEQGSKSGALKWLDTAAAAEFLPEAQIARAERLAAIAGYYTGIGVRNKAGDAAVSYLDYWEDLKELTRGNLVRSDNSKTALVMYAELIGQISDNCDRFRRAGVEQNELLEQIANAERRLSEDIVIDHEANRPMLEQSITAIQSAIETARAAVAANYPLREQGGQTDDSRKID